MRSILHKSLLALALFWCGSAQAIDVLDSAQNIFFSDHDNTRVGHEVEFSGLSPRQAAEIVQKTLGGTIQERTYHHTANAVEGPDGKIEYQVILEKHYDVTGTRVGNITLKVDTNTASAHDKIEQSGEVTELVGEPMTYKETVTLQKAIDQLKAAGAIGTERKNPVATQVNMEFLFKNKDGKPDVDLLLNLMRNYFSPEHRAQIREHLAVAPSRQAFLKDLSPGFTKKLFDPNYHPDTRQLFDDYIYRQSLELLDHADAWTMPIERAHKLLPAEHDPIVPRVVKNNPLRISSLLMHWNPDDAMTKLYETTGWTEKRPAIEFKEWNSEFDIVTPTRQALGLKESSLKYGSYDHDRLIYGLNGIDETVLRDLRKKHARNPSEPIVFRYFFGDPKTINAERYRKYYFSYYDNDPPAFIPRTNHGEKPVILPGESVVWHRRPYHRFTILGKYNPTLIDANIAHAMENKFVETKLWEEWVPGALPKTSLLSDFVSKYHEKKPSLKKALDTRYPNGWVMKGTWDLATEREIITNDMDIDRLVENYRHGDFERYKAQLIRENPHLQDAQHEILIDLLKKHPDYVGWKISRFIDKPYETLVQEKKDIAQEFRVEVIDGEVLGGGSTVDRYAYLETFQGRPAPVIPEDFKRGAEKHAQSIVDRMPKKFRGMPFAMDVAHLKDGSYAIIETNPGGNSSFLFEEESSVRELTKWLSNYPERVKKKHFPGLSNEEQMSYLKTKLHDWGLSTEKFYPGYRFQSDYIQDLDKSVRIPDKSYYSHVPNPCEAGWLDSP